MERTKAKRISSAAAIMDQRFYRGRPDRQAERDQTAREMALGLKIRRLREKAGLTQEELAERVGTRPSAISRIEDADYEGHSMDTLRRVADALGMLLIVDFQPKPGSPGERGTKQM